MMGFLYWALWIVDLLILMLAIWGKAFRSGFGAGVGLNSFVIICLLIILGGSLWLRLVLRKKELSLLMVSLPVLAMLLLYIWDSLKAGNSDSL